MIRLPLLGLIAALLLATSHALADETKPPKPNWKVAYAQVADVAVLRTAVAVEVKRGWPQHLALRRLVSDAILRVNLIREGYDPAKLDAAAIDEVVAESRAFMKKSGQTLEKYLARVGMTVLQYKDSLRTPLTFKKFIRDKLSEERLKELYKREALLLTGEVRASHILVKVSKARDATQARARAAALIKQLDKAPTAAAFSTLAQEASEDSLAPLTGGDLDWFRARGRSDAPGAVVRFAFRHGKPGLIPRPVRGADGFHVVLVTGVRTPPSATYARLRPRLLKRAAQLEQARTVRGWLARTKVSYAPDAPRRKR